MSSGGGGRGNSEGDMEKTGVSKRFSGGGGRSRLRDRFSGGLLSSGNAAKSYNYSLLSENGVTQLHKTIVVTISVFPLNMNIMGSACFIFIN